MGLAASERWQEDTGCRPNGSGEWPEGGLDARPRGGGSRVGEAVSSARLQERHHLRGSGDEGGEARKGRDQPLASASKCNTDPPKMRHKKKLGTKNANCVEDPSGAPRDENDSAGDDKKFASGETF
eukprot:EG_transcript_37660